MEKVSVLVFNWHQSGSVQDRDGAGENWSRYTVGKGGVISIEEQLPGEAFPALSYLVEFDTGAKVRVFNPCTVDYAVEPAPPTGA